ncbi:hypothetical protein [Pseudofrankia inefficax]|uniref:Integral membrane protein n=1 Tax=Pseudofrankia inefficax (strain DSM 45817 / CECT 9037 / DDB 130130 / EuI1c) TaxID=298654 RepID=E3JCD5_PSEI1|nr:hypothetical protein [Pseudofrankia inefficax]ADP84724.1 hypothetical protein FraEuI1c_6755 [Pseudofrankia inefficax]
MTITIDAGAPAAIVRPPVPRTVRAAQGLLLVPLGAFQLVASITFSISLGLHGVGEYAVAGWVYAMSSACFAAGLRLGRGGRRRLRAVLGLLVAEVGFSAVKLAVFHESASFVFFAFTAACAALLASPASRRHFDR